MALNWNRLRTWNGSQALAFEELCCQLAASEPVPAGARFFPKSAPDAGVECFWRFANGEEEAWQAKFFPSVPSAGQWKQLDDSVKTALSKHPRLRRYTICLPIDRPDARQKGRKSLLQKWGEQDEKWSNWAAKTKIAVEFDYWGEHEIFLRLSREEHRGRHWFWFDDRQFSLQWFGHRLEEAIENAGERYTPQLNVELPISD